jgi:hypothetical protein
LTLRLAFRGVFLLTQLRRTGGRDAPSERMSQPVLKRARDGEEEPAQGLPRSAWSRVVALLAPRDRAALRASCRALHTLGWALEPPEAPQLPARARKLRVLAARAPHLTRLCLLLDAADVQGDVDFFSEAVLGARPLRTALPSLTTLALELPGPSAVPPPPLNLQRLACPGGMELRLRHLPPPLKLPPGLFRFALCCENLADAHFARTDLGKHKTVRHVTLGPCSEGCSLGAGPQLLKALPPGLHSLRVFACPRLPAAGPFPKELRELALHGPHFTTDSMLAVRVRRSLRCLSDSNPVSLLCVVVVFVFVFVVFLISSPLLLLSFSLTLSSRSLALLLSVVALLSLSFPSDRGVWCRRSRV